MNVPDSYVSHTEIFKVRAYEVGSDNSLTIQTLCNYLQEAAGVHAERLGAAFLYLQGLGITWVLCKMILEVNEYPQAGSLIRVQTWPASTERIQCRRDFLWCNEDGRLLGRAATYWVIANMKTRRLERLPDFVRAFFPKTPFYALEDPGDKLPVLKSEPGAPAGLSFLARLADIDRNHHVNNVRYIDWAIESVPSEIRSTRKLCRLTVDFRAEAMLGDCIEVRAVPRDDGSWSHGIFRKKDMRELARVRTVWA